MFETILDALLDAFIDSAKLVPFLFLTYLFMEYLESHTSSRAHGLIQRTGSFGPLFGGLLGMFPQCGFSAAAAGLFASRTISLGTLLAIFLSTSDEMVPILISESFPLDKMLMIMALKALIGIVAGVLVDLLVRFLRRGKPSYIKEQVSPVSHKEHESLLRGALEHTLNILVFLFFITLALNLVFAWVGAETLTRLVAGNPLTGILLSALIGLIPNCGASVMLTQMYLRGVLLFSQLMAGLLVGAGVGLLVLFRMNRPQKQNLAILLLLYGLGVIAAFLLYCLGITLG